MTCHCQNRDETVNSDKVIIYTSFVCQQMEQELANYRARKRREALVANIKIKFRNMFAPKEKNDESILIEKESKDDSDSSEASNDGSTISNSDKESESKPTSKLKSDKLIDYCLCFLYFVFWITLYIIAIKFQFGIVYLLFSALFGMYFNTRTGSRKPGEASAYSVFNKDCEAIDGSLNAEQFEREIRFGPTSVR